MSNNSMLYMHDQPRRTLAVVLWIVLGATLALGVLNLQFRTWGSVIALFGLALCCLPMYWLNTRGYTSLAASLLCAIALIVITVNLYDGDGVRDSGLLAYPIFILLGALFFGARAAPIFTLAAIASLVTVAFLEIQGYVRPTIGPTRFDILAPIIILLLLASALNWVIVRNLERNFERVKASDAELRETYDLTLAAWARVLEYRHRETEGHSRRVVELSVQLARAMGCSPDDIAHLKRGALLHDIGKLAIPDNVLFKPGALNEQEQAIIQRHPVYAQEMLSGIPFLQPSICVAYSHHERWDGLGYPQGLKGEAIPLLARIFAVVDNWDALSSERPYRPAWSTEDITAYLRANAGTRFDPRVVERFLMVIA